VNSLKTYLNIFLNNYRDNPESPLRYIPNCCTFTEKSMIYLPFHIALFSAFMFLVLFYAYSVLHNVNILCSRVANVELFFVSISLLATMTATTILAIWGLRIDSKKCLIALFLIVLIFNILTFASLMTIMIQNDSGMMVKNDNGAIYKCNMAIFNLVSTKYKGSIHADPVLLDYNVTQMIGENNKCVFQQMDDICGSYGIFRQSIKLRDKQEALGAYICSDNNDEGGVSLCIRHSNTLNSYIPVAICIGFWLSLSLFFSNVCFFVYIYRWIDYRI